jgi:hypothetical protein
LGEVNSQEHEVTVEDLQQYIEHEDIRDVLNGSLEFDRELFIEEVKKYRCLWDTNATSYKERSSKANAWKQLSATFKKDGMKSFYSPTIITY